MAFLVETVNWEEGIHQLELNERAKGGPGGIANLQAEQLANRSQYLKKGIEDIGELIEGILTGPGGAKRPVTLVVGTSAAGYTADDVDFLCDGVDDQIEINAAITALSALGGKVLIREGTYSISARITVNKSYTTIEGMGASTVLKKMFNSVSSHEGTIQITASYCTAKNLRIDGDKSSFSGGYNHGIYVTGSYALIIDNFCDNVACGIVVYQKTDAHAVISGNHCMNCSSSGIWIWGSTYLTITGNHCCKNNNGIDARGSHLTVAGNTCTGNTNYGITCATSEYIQNIFTGNNCSYNGGGMNVSGIDLVISGNNLSQFSGSYGFQSINSERIVFTGNTCTRGTGLAGDYASTQYTIYLSGVSNSLIADNLILGKNYTALGSGSTGNTFVNNKYN